MSGIGFLHPKSNKINDYEYFQCTKNSGVFDRQDF